MNETEFFHQHLVPHLKQWGDYNRVENSAESGTPDISYAIDGIQGWIETKIIRNGIISFERFQLAWLRKRLRHSHGNLWIFATDQKSLFVFSAAQILAVEFHAYRDWLQAHKEDLPTPLVYGPVLPWPWGQVLVLLTQSRKISDNSNNKERLI